MPSARVHIPPVALFCAATASYQIVENRLLVKLGAHAEWKAATTIWIDDTSDDVLLRESNNQTFLQSIQKPPSV